MRLEKRIDAALREGRERLNAITDTPSLEAELLLAYALDKPRTYLRAWPEQPVDADPLAAFETLLTRRSAGEPIAYLLGRREFWSLELEVSPGVLIPRPDTETLVERALQLIPPNQPVRIADLGTGSGAIALAIASERPFTRVVASDRSQIALDMAMRNAARLGIQNVEFRLGDWCLALHGESFDLIASNPPYIAASDPHLGQEGLPYEPNEALIAGMDGLDDLRRIIACAPPHLRSGGHLLVEHGIDQGAEVRELLRAANFEDIQTHCDLEGRERISEGLIHRHKLDTTAHDTAP